MALLSILLFRAWRETLPAMGNPRWTFRWAKIAVLGTALVASLDEWHQSFIPSRTGTVRDVLLDTCAAIARADSGMALGETVLRVPLIEGCILSLETLLRKNCAAGRPAPGGAKRRSKPTIATMTKHSIGVRASRQ